MDDEPRRPLCGAPDAGGNCATCAGGFFHNARQLLISGGTFTSNVYPPEQSIVIPADFRMIPLGDVLNQICIADTSGAVRRRQSSRKIYAARLAIDGRLSKMTAAVYQGEIGEEEWRHELKTYTGIRHPNIVQIYGTVKSRGLYATLFYGEFMPLAEFCNMYKDSPIASL
ncbi:hypothetical protein K438DRAFT_2023226 [Mycena galopus ATCC 62051]|nr:hypothetical protein K438DRAFT_2023226 [Mycena galopus ATCC 62051]